MTITNHLISLIKIKGHLTIAEFMQEALFNPKYGYYQKQIPIGKDGDFTTAPEISQVFGELIALYFLNIASHTNKPIAFVEMGAGKGTLLKDILSTIQKLANKKVEPAQDFLNKTSFNIIEISPALQAVQKEKLNESNITLNWHCDFQSFQQSAVTQDREIYFLANELFDCFPINQFVKTKEGWCEKVVSLKDEELAFFIEDVNPLKSKMIEKLVALENQNHIKENAIFEHSVSSSNFMQELANAINEQGGLALIIDYGYSTNQFKNSLQSLKSHQYHNCLEHIGQADITALVNFSSLERIAIQTGLQSSLISQKMFLEGLGIEDRRTTLLEDKEPEQQKEINAGIDRLISPQQMGDLFKCLIIWK